MKSESLNLLETSETALLFTYHKDRSFSPDTSCIAQGGLTRSASCGYYYH